MASERKVICGGRKSGKTQELVEAAIAADGIVLVATHAEAEDLRKRFPELRRHNIMTTGERERRMGHSGPIFVDNADVILSRFLGIYSDDLTVTWNGTAAQAEAGDGA